VKTLGFGGIVFNIRVVGGEASVVDDDGGGGLRRLRAALLRGRGLRWGQLAGVKEPFQGTDKALFRRSLRTEEE